jgi:hypothetical protein
MIPDNDPERRAGRHRDARDVAELTELLKRPRMAEQ